MTRSRSAAIRQENTLIVRGKFKVDEVTCTYDRPDGTKRELTRLVFERGDAAAILLLNTDSDSVVLVDQFRLPTLVARRRDGRSEPGGWLTEAIAGMVEPNETPKQAIAREALEETGYRIRDPNLICTFFASPGGSSERIFLYFAEVTNADRQSRGGGEGDEDIAIVEWSISDLFRQVRNGQIEDPKLAIAAYWLQDRVKEPLAPSTIQYRLQKNLGLIIGCKTGKIDDVRDVDVWVNSENTDMTMDRFIGRSVSARIRYLGAKKDQHTIFEDTIQDALRTELGPRGFVRIGAVLVTGSGMLRNLGVEKIFHVAAVEGRPGTGIRADPDDLEACVQAVLQKVDEENGKSWFGFRRTPLDSVLFPMLGAGEGGLETTVVADKIIPAAVRYLENVEQPTMKEVYFLAFKRPDKCACAEVFKQYCDNGTLVRVP